LLRVIS